MELIIIFHVYDPLYALTSAMLWCERVFLATCGDWFGHGTHDLTLIWWLGTFGTNLHAAYDILHCYILGLSPISSDTCPMYSLESGLTALLPHLRAWFDYLYMFLCLRGDVDGFAHWARLRRSTIGYFIIIWPRLAHTSISWGPHVSILMRSRGTIYYIWHQLLEFWLGMWFEQLVLCFAHGILPRFCINPWF